MEKKILDKIDSPEDVKRLSTAEMESLAKEVRDKIVDVVSKNGGHLSSNLGVVELTIALHKVFTTPKDKIVFDVGHQSYTHKMLTGRKDRIDVIRQKDGLTGYPDIFESEHDALNTGHASTSIGVASGMAVATQQKKTDSYTIAVIGDGALTGGVALEALNHIGQIGQKMIIVLNDNKMSISPNVGGISKHLNYLVSGRPYLRMKEMFHSVLNHIPGIGKNMVDSAKKLENLMKSMVVPGSLFDELGVKYVGPVNGHDIDELIKEFESVKDSEVPVLLHVITEKGAGYQPAEENPSSFHSSAPFDIEDGKFIKSDKPSYSKIFGQTVLKLIEQDSDVNALTAAMPGGTGLDQVQKKYPDNFYDVGIAEQYMLDFAAGMSLNKLKPVMGIYSTFLQRALDQVIHDFSIMDIPVVTGIDRAGLVGGDGITHQGIYDIAMLRMVPGAVIMAPKDENELQHMIYSGIKYKKTVFVRYPKEPGLGVQMDEEFKEIPFGKAELVREGKDCLILAVGPMVSRAEKVAEMMAEQDGLEAAILNMRFVKPFDKEEVLAYARKIKNIVTIEDGTLCGGFGSAVKELMLAEGLKKNCVLSIGVPEDARIPVATRNELLQQYRMNEDAIYEDVREFLKSSKRKFFKVLTG